MKKIVALIAIFALGGYCAFAFTSPGNPTGYVNDYTNTLSVETKQNLESVLKANNASTTNEIAVVIVSTTGNETIEEYATKLFESWKVGTEKNDNGVLFVIAKDDHKMRIEVGYGLEGALPDLLAKDILDNRVAPFFKQGKYDEGVTEGVYAIIKATEGEYRNKNNTPSNSLEMKSKYTHEVKDVHTEDSLADAVKMFLVVLFFVAQFFASILARSKSWWAGGVLGGALGVISMYLNIFGLSIMIGSLITFVLILLGLLFDYVVSTSYNNAVRSGSGIPWWVGGGSSGGGYSSSSSFGGFGGGSSGGGGASSSW